MTALTLTAGDRRDRTVSPRLGLTNRTAASQDHAYEASLRGPIILGMLTLLIGVGGFFLWAASTNLSSAAVASGRVVVESNTKTVSHLEGGTLRELRVQEGDKVRVGDVLATLEVTRSEAVLRQLQQQLFEAKAQLARLVVERNEDKVFTYEARVPDGMDSTTAGDVLLTERRLFVERTGLFRDQIAADKSAVDQLANQRAAITARRQSWIEQGAVIERELETYTKLHARKLITAGVFNAKLLQLLDIKGRIAESDAALAENDEREKQLELSAAGRRNDYFRNVSVEIQKTQSTVVGLRQQIVSSEDVVAKAAIRAPQDGIVANIRIRTPGSAVVAGSPLLDIVPANQPMLIEGFAPARDIDQMRLGQKAEIKLSAFGATESRPLIGHVTYIAPDSVTDERTGDVRFAFRAKIDAVELRAQPNLFLYPGMSAEVYIVTGDRTALDYLTEPIRRSFSRAFREQ